MDSSVLGSKRKLRNLELRAYGGVVDALRAQGPLTKDKQEVLKRLGAVLHVSEERCRAEMRRAVNDEALASIARTINGCETEYVWRTESVRKIPFAPMIAPKTVFTSFADTIADIVSRYNLQFENARSSAPPPNMEEIRRANMEENIQRESERRFVEPILAKIKFNDEAILEELNKIKYNNKFSDPEEYLSKIYDPRKVNETDAATSTTQEASAMSIPTPRTFPIPMEDVVPSTSKSTVNEQLTNIGPVIETFASKKSVTNTESLIEILSADDLVSSVTVRNVESVIEVSPPGEPMSNVSVKPKKNSPLEISSSDESASNVLPKTIKIQLHKILHPYKLESNVPLKNPQPKTFEQSTRMVRKAKLNAKRWNPKTQTLEPPLKRVSPDLKDDGSENNSVETKPPVRNKTAKSSVHQQATHGDGDAVERTICSTQRGRQTTRWFWGRKRRIRNEVRRTERSEVTESYVNVTDNEVTDNHVKNVAVKFRNKSANSPRKKLKNAALTTAVEKNTKEPSELAKGQLHLPRHDSDLPASKSNVIGTKPLIQGSVSSSRPISILRRRVCPARTQANEPSNKFRKLSTSIEISKEDFISNSVADSSEDVSFRNFAKKSKNLVPNCTADIPKGEESIISTDFIASTQSSALVHNRSLADISNALRNSSTDVPEEAADHSASTKSKVLYHGLATANVSVARRNSSTDASTESGEYFRSSSADIPAEKINCNSVTESIRSIESCTTDTQKEEINCDSTTYAKELVYSSTSDISEEEQADKPRGGVRSDLTKEASVLPKLSQKRRRVKILPAGCDETVSKLLLGSRVRVRNATVRKPCVIVDLHPNTNTKSTIAVETENNSCEKNKMVLLSDNDHELRGYTGSMTPVEPGNSSYEEKVSNDEPVAMVIDTISRINEDWEDSDMFAIDQYKEKLCKNEQGCEDEGKDAVDESTEPILPKRQINGPLSSMIGMPPWAPKIIKANSIPENRYDRLLKGKSVRTYVPGEKNASFHVITPSLSGRRRKEIVTIDEVNTDSNRKEMSPEK